MKETCRKTLFIFDLDGTLIDAYPAIIESTTHVLSSLGYPPATEREIVRAVGWGNDSLLETFINPRDIGQAREIYLKHHLACLPDKAKLLPGARKLLETLKGENGRLAVATNRGRRSTDLVLDSLGLSPFFDLVVCGEEVPHPKPAPDILLAILNHFGSAAEKALYFGDMTIDAQTGRKAGVETVIVSTGSSDKKEIEAESPGLVLDSLLDFLETRNPFAPFD